jgi:hypothetical protein
MSDQERPPEFITNQDIIRSFEATKDMYNSIMLQLGVLKGHVESQAASTSASILFITQRLRALEKTKGEHSGLSDEMLEQKFESMTSLELSNYMTDLHNELDQADALYSRALDRMHLAIAIKTRKGAEPK